MNENASFLKNKLNSSFDICGQIDIEPVNKDNKVDASFEYNQNEKSLGKIKMNVSFSNEDKPSNMQKPKENDPNESKKKVSHVEVISIYD